MNVMSGHRQQRENMSAINSWHSQLMLYRRVSVTFEQQRHEGDVRRTEFGHSQSVGPVVAWGILKGAENQQSTVTALESFREINETYWNESTRCNLPSASHKHSKFFLSCWGFSAIRAKRCMSHYPCCCLVNGDTFNITVNVAFWGFSHLPGLVKPVYRAVAQTEHHSEERIEILLLL